MDYFFVKMKSVVTAATKSAESVTCIAVEGDRHQIIMSSAALTKWVEEPWTIERVAKFIDLRGYCEITLKSDTEPAIIAFRDRVAETCQAEVTTEDAVKGDSESNGLIENAVMLTRGIIRTIKCHVESSTQEPLPATNHRICRVWWNMPDSSCPGVRKGRDGKTPFERLHGKRPSQ